MPKINIFSSPTSSHISTLAPSKVPMVKAPFSYKKKMDNVFHIVTYVVVYVYVYPYKQWGRGA